MNASNYFENRLQTSIRMLKATSELCSRKAHEALANGFRALAKPHRRRGGRQISPNCNATSFAFGVCQHVPTGRPDNAGACAANGL